MVRFLKVLVLVLCLAILPAAADDVTAIPDTEFVVVARATVVLPPQDLPELPEPAVLIMMLLGICVIGYRVRRDSRETFR